MPTPCCRCCQKKPTDLEVVHVYEVPDPPLLSRALQRGLLEVLYSDHSRTASRHFEEGRGAIERHTEPERKEENKREIFPSQPKYHPPLADLISCPLALATFSSFLSFRHCTRRHSALFIFISFASAEHTRTISLCVRLCIFITRKYAHGRAKPPAKAAGGYVSRALHKGRGTIHFKQQQSASVPLWWGVRGRRGRLCTCALLFT